MYVNFNEDAKKVIKHAKGEMLKLNHPYVGSEHIILSMLKNYDRLESIFRKQHITYDKFQNFASVGPPRGYNGAHCFCAELLLPEEGLSLCLCGCSRWCPDHIHQLQSQQTDYPHRSR